MHYGFQTQPSWGISLVPLVRVLDLSPCGWSVLEVTQSWLVLSGTRSLDQVQFSTRLLHWCFLFPSVSEDLIRVSIPVATICPLSALSVSEVGKKLLNIQV